MNKYENLLLTLTSSQIFACWISENSVRAKTFLNRAVLYLSFHKIQEVKETLLTFE